MRDTSPMSADRERHAVPSRAVATTGTLLLLIGLVPGFPPSLRAQAPDHGRIAAAGERYRAGPIRRWILGRHYRDV